MTDIKTDPSVTHVSIAEYNAMADQRDFLRTKCQDAAAVLGSASDVVAEIKTILAASEPDEIKVEVAFALGELNAYVQRARLDVSR